MRYRVLGLVLSLLVFTGCVERSRIVSTPQGARVFLDGHEVGVTPYTFVLQRDELRDIPYRVELAGYQPVEGVLRKDVAKGRVVGAVFTLGLLYAFRSPYYVQSAKLALAVQPNAYAPAAQLPPVEDRLRKLKDLRDDGVLSAQEYEEQKARILRQSQ